MKRSTISLPRKPCARKLCLEPLEDRTLLSSGALADPGLGLPAAPVPVPWDVVVHDWNGDLFGVQSSNRITEFLGTMDVIMDDMAFFPWDDGPADSSYVFYGVAPVGQWNNSHLYRVLVNPAGSPVVTTEWLGPILTDGDEVVYLDSLTFDGLGTLFGAGQLDFTGIDYVFRLDYQIAPGETSRATHPIELKVGAQNFSTAGDIAFGGRGELYVTTESNASYTGALLSIPDPYAPAPVVQVEFDTGVSDFDGLTFHGVNNILAYRRDRHFGDSTTCRQVWKINLNNNRAVRLDPICYNTAPFLGDVYGAANRFIRAHADFGDAPDDPDDATDYPTLLASDGARHRIASPDGVPDLYLGIKVDAELEGQPNADAVGDDNSDDDDEDGVVFDTPLLPGSNAQITVTASGSGYLDAWIDFNSDGDWADPGEQIFGFPVRKLLNAGPNVLTFPVPPGADLSDAFARFRFSSTGFLPYYGFVGLDGVTLALDGEVEDYRVPQGPVIATLSDAPDPVVQGNDLTLTATGVSDPDGTVDHVTFYRETNGTAGLQTGAGGDEAVGTDHSASGGWWVTVATAGLVGTYTYYAQATDDDGLPSPDGTLAPSTTNKVIMDWSKIHAQSPETMVTADLDGNGKAEVVADFGATGVWVWRDGPGWDGARLQRVSPELLVAGDLDANGEDDLVFDFGPASGIWIYLNETAWDKIHGQSPQTMVTADLDGNGKDDLIADFGAAGVWAWRHGPGWDAARLQRVSPELLVAGDLDANGEDDLVFDFGAASGIWVYLNEADWDKIHTQSPETMVTADLDANGKDDLIADFGATGVWVWRHGSGWDGTKLHTVSPESMAAGDLDGNGQDDLALDFGAAYGIWIYYNEADWDKLHNQSPEEMVAGNIDATAGDDVVVDFGAAGLWTWKNHPATAALHSLSPASPAAGGLNDGGFRDGDAAGLTREAMVPGLFAQFGRQGLSSVSAEPIRPYPAREREWLQEDRDRPGLSRDRAFAMAVDLVLGRYGNGLSRIDDLPGANAIISFLWLVDDSDDEAGVDILEAAWGHPNARRSPEEV